MMAVQDAQHTRKGAFPAEIEAAAEIAQLPNPLPLDYEPRDTTEFLACLKDPLWRICSGQLYKIMTKDDEHQEGAVAQFKPNISQRQFLANLHNRNLILKARQLGFTTLSCIYFLDHAIFNDHQSVGIIAHHVKDAEKIFKQKVRFAYEQLPEIIQKLYPLESQNTSELFLKNGSTMFVTASARSGTTHRLHVSELGKMAAKYPGKAYEVVTGSLPAVPKNGIVIIESTAEGQEGEFFKIADRAEKRSHDPTPLGAKEFKFHFFPWFITPEYATDPRHIRIKPEQHEYFDKIEAEMGVRLKLPQRAWYVTTLENEQSGDSEKMWREYPSTPAECWMRSTEGTWFAPQLARARAEGRLCPIPHVSNVPVHTFWDIGSGDGTGIWAMQDVGTRHRFIRYFEDWAKGYSHYVKLLRDTGWLFGIHYLPHDATHERQLANTVAAPLSMLQELAPDWRFRIVPRVPDLTQGINMTREAFGQCWFNIDGSGEDCEAGIRHLDLYKKKWNSRLGVFTDEPEKLDGHTEAADSLRQYAQGYDPAHFNAPTAPKRRSRGAMTA